MKSCIKCSKHLKDGEDVFRRNGDWWCAGCLHIMLDSTELIRVAARAVVKCWDTSTDVWEDMPTYMDRLRAALKEGK